MRNLFVYLSIVRSILRIRKLLFFGMKHRKTDRQQSALHMVVHKVVTGGNDAATYMHTYENMYERVYVAMTFCLILQRKI